MIEFKSVSKNFSQGAKQIQVLKDMSCLLDQKGLIAIVGKSGSGKSTFLSLLAGLDSPTSGKIEIDGHNIAGMNESELTAFRAKNIGIIFQQFHLVENFTALENVMLPLEVLGMDNVQSKAKEVLNFVGLADRADHFPRQLSGGEKQRVAIARAYVTNPKIILADEPSGNLDPETGEAVMQQLFDTAKELHQTVILVTHDYDLADKCDVKYQIKDQMLVQV